MADTLTVAELRAQGSDLVSRPSSPTPESRPEWLHPGRRFRSAAALADWLDAVLARGAVVSANLRALPPADESRDLARAANAAERVCNAVAALDRALGWREGA